MSSRLPSTANLAQLKKQAKELLNGHKHGDLQAMKRLAALTRFRGTSLDQIREARVSLQEAQHALAREYGFAGWDQLLSALQTQHATACLPRDFAALRLTGDSWKHDTSSLVMETISRIIGRDTDYETLACLSTNAFAPCMNINEDQPERWPLYGRDAGFDIVGQALGLRIERLIFPPFLGDERSDKDQQNHMTKCAGRIKEAMGNGAFVIADGGYCAPGCDYTSWVIVTSAPKDGRITAACLNGKNDNVVTWMQTYWAVHLDAVTLTPAQASILALSRTVQRIRGIVKPLYPGVYFGITAIEKWAEQMRIVPYCAHCYEFKPDSMWSCAQGTAMSTFHLAGVAAEYLTAAVQEYPIAARSHLQTAARCYQRIIDLLSPAMSDNRAESYKAIMGIEQRQIEHAEKVIVPCGVEYTQAADEIEKALSSVSGDINHSFR